jgi:nitrogen fixation-related uncharacterized protein
MRAARARSDRRIIMGFIESLPDGWTIYVWLFAGAAIIVAAIVWMRWGFKNEQFDEDIKYVVFNEQDKDKMTPEEFAKYEEVMKSQLASRERHLALQAAQKRG